MTRRKNIFGTLFVAALLPVSYLVMNPSGAMKISAVEEQRINIAGRVSFWGRSTHGSRVVNADFVDLCTDKTGTGSVRIDLPDPVDLYKHSIVMFVRCRQAEELLKLTLTDRNSFTTVYNVVEPVAVNRRWAKVVITDKGLAGVWNIDKSQITALRLTSEKMAHGAARVVEIKGIALRKTLRYNN
jgi:hypothetical protein